MVQRALNGLLVCGLVAGAWSVSGAQAPQPTDLDGLMARALDNRGRTSRTLRDYVLDEQERFQLMGPAGVPLFGIHREYTWYMRDGTLVRSPLRFDGVSIDPVVRREYEDRWLREEAERASSRRAKREGKATDGADAQARKTAAVDAAAIASEMREPRLVSEAYFLEFRFEPGNYFLAGREVLDGREVLRVEYYPEQLFREDNPDRDSSEEAARSADTGDDEDEDLERDFEHRFNKVALITLWVDPVEAQIVRYTFDNVDFDFLPFRWMARVEEASASMTMGRFLDGVWLPRQIRVEAAVTLANGTFDAEYERTFSDYRQAETKARIRAMAPVER